MSLSAFSVAVLLALAGGPAQLKPEVAKGYAEILEKHVQKGRVDYKSLAATDLPKLDAYLKAVADAPVPKDKWAAIAFYVDAYNATVLRAVIAHAMPKSVLDVSGFFDKETHKIAGKELTLNDHEKKVLIPLARDPRVHMVLVCGAVGCPILESKPYSGRDVNARLDEATKRYLSGPTGIVATANWLRISRIFTWYAPDFDGDAGALQFVRKYGNAAIIDKAGPSPKVSYIDYNWTLNAQ